MKCVSGIEVLPLLAVAHRVWRRWKIRRIRSDWKMYQDLRRLAKVNRWDLVLLAFSFEGNYITVKAQALDVPGRVNEI